MIASFLHPIIESLRPGEQMKSAATVQGGDINESYCITLRSGEIFFVKTNTTCSKDFFFQEACNLRALSEPLGGAHVPRVMGVGQAEEGMLPFLALEYLTPGRATEEYWSELGRALAVLHGTSSVQYGWEANNYIGSTPQLNRPHDSWIDFYIQDRLEPQVKLAEKKGYFSKEDSQKSLHFHKWLQDEWCSLGISEKPALCHGDLWAGNVYAGSGGLYFIDPASYFGFYETDLAMTELFGPFPVPFYDGYLEMHPIENGYRERIPIWNLYHLLNHLNLFGGSYYHSVQSIYSKFS